MAMIDGAGMGRTGQQRDPINGMNCAGIEACRQILLLQLRFSEVYFVKIAFGIITCTPLLRSTTSVMSTSPATLTSM